MLQRKIRFVVVALSLSLFPVLGFCANVPQAPSAAPAAVPATVGSPEKLSDIRKLISLTGGDQMGKQMMEQMVESFKSSFPQTPADFWSEFLNESNSKELMDLNVPIYDKHLTHDEIKEIIKFYESPTGQKLIQALPQISQESYVSGEKWGYELGMKVREKLIKGGFLKDEAADSKQPQAMPAESTPMNATK